MDAGPLPHDVVKRALGVELRRAREMLGWSRAELADHLPAMQEHVIYTYEQGVRNCTVARLVEICEPLGIDPPEVLGLALQRAKMEARILGLVIDLRAVARDDSAGYRPVQRWAHVRLEDGSVSNGVVRLSHAVLREMAVILGYTRESLVRYLSAFAPGVAPSA
jgi:transcriptional regulator with XRE-family HTH domain